MFYEFPEIRHISDVLPHIEGRNEFVIANRCNHTIINYNVNFEDTFFSENSLTQAIRRECRGIVFDENGNILSRRFHKFFNLGEKDETRIENIDFNVSHVMCEKLDGSMITPLILDGVVRWGTKMGLTEVAANVEEFVTGSTLGYRIFAEICHNLEITPIFEWCSHKNRIVVDYEEDKLVLLAVRENISGRYLSRTEITDIMSHNPFYDCSGIPLVKEYSSDTTIEEIRSWENCEGIVISFDNGHKVKVKADMYVLRHKSKDSISVEKNIISYIVNDQVDDVLPYLAEDDQKRLTEFQTRFWNEFDLVVSDTNDLVTKAIAESNNDRKKFALEVATKYPSWVKSVVFTVWDGKISVRNALLNIIRCNTGTASKIDSVRHLFGNLRWSYDFFDG